ncbi:MAG: hypothetical protein ABEJ05_11485 [Haloglomus sp.]
MESGQETVDEVRGVVRTDRDRIERALVEFDREALCALGVDPDAVVGALFTPAFVDENTDFADLDELLSVAGAASVWDLAEWIDWVLDWHVLGNTRFWSWEWMVHAAVAARATAAAVGPVRCPCGGPVVPIAAADAEEPGRADGRWVEYRCEVCGSTGRATRAPDGSESIDGLERP